MLHLGVFARTEGGADPSEATQATSEHNPVMEWPVNTAPHDPGFLQAKWFILIVLRDLRNMIETHETRGSVAKISRAELTP